MCVLCVCVCVCVYYSFESFLHQRVANDFPLKSE